jgi:uncharacterized membrane protein YphA (DoxX/SURF4 family)
MEPHLFPVLALAVVFFASGAGKLRSPDAAVQAMRMFRIPAVQSRGWGLALGGAELAAAVAVLVPAWHKPVAAAMALFLAAATALVGLALARGERFACACFGGGEVISGWTLARNGALLTLAVAALAWSDVTARQPFPVLLRHAAFTVLVACAAALAWQVPRTVGLRLSRLPATSRTSGGGSA